MTDRIRRIHPDGLPDPQAAVRVAHFERAIGNLMVEIGGKTAFLLEEYDRRYVEPIRQRVAYLELPFYRRWWLTLLAVPDRVRARIAVWREELDKRRKSRAHAAAVLEAPVAPEPASPAPETPA